MNLWRVLSVLDMSLSDLDGPRYFKEYWSGDSRDGQLVSGEGFHYFRIEKDGLISEAFEGYETDEGDLVVSLVPEMFKKNWFSDFGYENLDILEGISEKEFSEIKSLLRK